MLKQFLTTVALVTLSLSAQAKVKLPNILCDNMVLQQNTEARLWGWDKPGKKVNVTTSWNNETYAVKTGKDGKWVCFPACPSPIPSESPVRSFSVCCPACTGISSSPTILPISPP